MNCHYCHQPCEKLPDVYYYGGGLAWRRHHCNKCPVRIHYSEGVREKENEIDFLWEEEDKRYRVFCNMTENFCTIQYQTKANKDWQTFEIELEFVPKWDPQTIKEKVKTYLVFS